MKANPLPDQNYLNECLEYYPLTGALVWRERPVQHFATERSQRSWNAKNAGQEAFYLIEESGYCRGSLDGTRQLAHRIIWKMLYGTEPENIDHDNGIRHDNREVNLKASTKLLNMKNKALYTNNKYGVPGIRAVARGFSIYLGNTYIGFKSTLEEAISLRQEAQSKDPNYTERHGK